MTRKKGVFALLALAAVPLAALGIVKAAHREALPPEGPSAPAPASAKPDRPTLGEDREGESEPGGTLVVLGLFAILGLVGVLVAAFAFPPGYVAAVLVFGLVSLLGLVVLYVHYRAHASKDTPS